MIGEFIETWSFWQKLRIFKETFKNIAEHFFYIIVIAGIFDLNLVRNLKFFV